MSENEVEDEVPIEEKTYSIIFQIKPIDPPFDGVKRFMICYDREARPTNIEGDSCRLAYNPQFARWSQYVKQVTLGEHYLSFALWLAIEETHTVDCFIQATDGYVPSQWYYVGTYVCKHGEPKNIKFVISREHPYISGLTLHERKASEEIPRDYRNIVTHNPESATLLESISQFAEDVFQGISGVGNSLSGLFGIGLNLITGGITALLGSIGDFVTGTRNSFAIQSVNSIIESLKGSPVWQNDLLAQQDPITQTFAQRWSKLIDPSIWIPEDPTLQNYIAQSHKMTGELIHHKIGDNIFGLGIEAGTLGQIEGMSNLLYDVQKSFGIDEIVKQINLLPIEKAMLQPFEHAVNSTFPTAIPTYTDLIEMVVKEVITLEQFKTEMLKEGYNKEWSQRIWDKHFIAPNFGDVRRAFHRGALNDEQLIAMMKLVDLDPRYNTDVWLPLIEEIPNVSELVNQRVKEVIGDQTFGNALKFHGYSPIWGQRIWDAHFIPPSLGDIMTAYRRQVPVTIPIYDEETGLTTTKSVTSLSVSDVHDLMKLVDLDPRYNSIFDTRFYRDPSIREARYMFETGAIGEDRVKDVVIRSGLDPDYVDDMTHYLTHFVERAYQRRYLTVLSTAYASQTYNETQVTELTTKAGFTEGVANWVIEIGKVRRDIEITPREIPKPRILTVAQLDKAYVKDLIDESNYTTRMLQMGYETLDISLKVQLLDMDKTVEEVGTRVIRLTTAQLLNAWKYEEMTEDEVRTELGLRGLDQLNIDRLINTKKKQWDIGGESP